MGNTEKFEILLFECCLTQANAANVISEITQRPLSARAVRSWLTDPRKSSHRPCPDWAVQALEEYKRNPSVFIDDEPESALEPRSQAIPVVPREEDEAIKAGLPYTVAELEAAFEGALTRPKKKPRRDPRVQQDYENIRYKCPGCKVQVWGKRDLWVVCGECHFAMDEVHPIK